MIVSFAKTGLVELLSLDSLAEQLVIVVILANIIIKIILTLIGFLLFVVNHICHEDSLI